MPSVVDVCARIGTGRPEETRSLETALAEMDMLGVSRAWVAPPDECVAVYNRRGNEMIAEAVAAHPGRLVGYAVANPWYGLAAVEELDRAFRSGLRALFLLPPVQGFQLSDPLVDPLIEVAVAHRAPVYAHTGTPICSEPFQLSALARRHSQARFIMGHMGYADFWYDGPSAAALAGNIWLETSFMNYDVVSSAVRALGAHRFLFGSAAPLSAIVPEMAKIRSLPFSPNDLARILGGNAEALL